MAPITEAPAGGAARVAVIVVNFRTPDLALACVDSLAADRAGGSPPDVVLVDGGSGDGSAERLAEGLAARGSPQWIELLPLPVNGGFGYANNQALLLLAERPLPPDYVCLLNPDAKALPGAVPALAALLDRCPRAAAVGARLEGGDGAGQGSAFSFPSLRGELSRGAQTDVVRRLLHAPPIVLAAATARPAPWVTGAAVMLRVAALREVGLFDDGFFLYFEEVELMHRLALAGWEIWHEPAARVEHLGGGATDVRWDEGGFHKPMPLPPYWYASRRRYFARTGGIARAMLATLLFVLGRMLWLTRCALQRRRDRFPERSSRDMLRHGLWPSRADRAPVRLPRLGEPRGAVPAWRRAQAGR